MKRILIVEDQEDLRAILRDLLTGSGYEVIEAVDGAEAVAQAQAQRPDLILMDIQLPVLDGYEATRRIKSTRPGGDPDHCGQLVRDEGRRGEGAGRRLRPLRDQALQPDDLARRHSGRLRRKRMISASGLWVRFRGEGFKEPTSVVGQF